jgi:hypothetical protein
MEQIAAMRSRPRVPAINYGSGSSGARVDRHLAILAGPAVPKCDAEEAMLLMRELTTRDHARAKTSRSARVSLFAPLRRLRRSLFGNQD